MLRLDSGQWFESVWVDLSSHNANPPGVFDGEAVSLSDVADTRIEESVAALRRFVAEHGSLLTAESWTEAAMRLSEKTIRRRFGSFREEARRPWICKLRVAFQAMTAVLCNHEVA